VPPVSRLFWFSRPYRFAWLFAITQTQEGGLAEARSIIEPEAR
jgi:hypothetical protein